MSQLPCAYPIPQQHTLLVMSFWSCRSPDRTHLVYPGWGSRHEPPCLAGRLPATINIDHEAPEHPRGILKLRRRCSLGRHVAQHGEDIRPAHEPILVRVPTLKGSSEWTYNWIKCWNQLFMKNP